LEARTRCRSPTSLMRALCQLWGGRFSKDVSRDVYDWTNSVRLCSWLIRHPSLRPPLPLAGRCGLAHGGRGTSALSLFFFALVVVVDVVLLCVALSLYAVLVLNSPNADTVGFDRSRGKIVDLAPVFLFKSHTTLLPTSCVGLRCSRYHNNRPCWETRKSSHPRRQPPSWGTCSSCRTSSRFVRFWLFCCGF
jgi:hypothetical protein